MQPILALTGQNDILKLDELEKRLKDIPSDSIRVIFADETDPVAEIRDFAEAGLFGGGAVTVIKNLDQVKESVWSAFEKALSALLEHPDPDKTLILLSESFSKPVTDQIKQAGEVVEFRKFYREDCVRYAFQSLKSKKANFDPDVPDYLVTLSGEDLLELKSMVETVSGYSTPESKIDIPVCQKLLARSANQGVFEFIGAFFTRKTAQALTALSDLRAQGEAPSRILSLLYRSARLLWGYYALQNKADAASSLGIKPFEAKKIAEYARFTDLKRVSATLSLCQRVEAMSKTMPEEFAFGELEQFLAG